MIRPWHAALALLSLGCRSAAPAPAPPPAEAPSTTAAESPAQRAPEPEPVPLPAPPRALELPRGWDTQPLESFGELLEQNFPAGQPRTLVPSAFEELSSALRADDPLALRALELLARCRDPLAGEILLQRLERRGTGTAELGAAIDTTAAAAARAFPDARNAAARLEALALGRKPHPDLEVRVECASSALQLGRERAGTFLIAILKHGTRLYAASSSWKPIADMSFCQRRAAEALCERAGRPCRYRPLQALDEREADIRALETALAPGRN